MKRKLCSLLCPWCVCYFKQDLSYKDRHWHEDCFACFQCKRPLVDKPFSTKDEQLLCTECYSNEYSSKCHDCKKTIMPGMEAGLIHFVLFIFSAPKPSTSQSANILLSCH